MGFNAISPSGKVQDFDSCIRRFESGYSSCRVLVAESSAKNQVRISRKLSRTKNRNRVRLADCGLTAKPI